jgi:hypothetical protein
VIAGIEKRKRVYLIIFAFLLIPMMLLNVLFSNRKQFLPALLNFKQDNDILL